MKRKLLTHNGVRRMIRSRHEKILSFQFVSVVIVYSMN